MSECLCLGRRLLTAGRRHDGRRQEPLPAPQLLLPAAAAPAGSRTLSKAGLAGNHPTEINCPLAQRLLAPGTAVILVLPAARPTARRRQLGVVLPPRTSSLGPHASFSIILLLILFEYPRLQSESEEPGSLFLMPHPFSLCLYRRPFSHLISQTTVTYS